MTIYDDTGISIGVQSNIFAAQTDLGQYADEISGYSHQIDADGGYRKATITLNLDQAETEDWYEAGLMRHVTTYNEAGEVIFEGFVNQVSISIGGLSITRGPVLGTINRLSAAYTRLDMSVDPPVAGAESITTIADDAAAQALYGVLEAMISAGTVSDADALQIRDAYIAERKNPPVSQSLDLSGNANPTVALEIAGYVEYLDKFIYDNAATTTTTISAKIQAVLAARPNAIISTDYRNIATNAYLVPAAENNQPGMSVIKALLAVGDVSYSRYNLGVYAGRKAYYSAVPTAFAYQMTLAAAEFELYGGGMIYPWNALPARWIFYPDFLVGRGAPASNLRSDPRAQFIESVSYTAPFGLSLSGGRTDKLSQRLAQYGISGG